MSLAVIIVIVAVVLLLAGAIIYCKCRSSGHEADDGYQRAPDGASGNFWTPELIKKFNHIDFSKKDNREATRETV